ncbi:MAG: hypothetical protein E7077_01990 [Bacteroidales bacterium]|jgi:hypothetical protein|nr:hypothetical protein [Bacteroidales bacterium]
MDLLGCLSLIAMLFFAVVSIIAIIGGLIFLAEILAIAVIYFVSKKENRLSHIISYSVGSAIFFFLFFIFSCFSIFFCGSSDSNVYLGDTRYVKINDKYTLKSIDNFPFYIEGKRFTLDYVDSLAESQNYLYGHASDSYFSLNMEDGIVRKDSLFENLELPEYCIKEKIIGAEEFLINKDSELSRSITEVLLWPFILALIFAYLSSFYTKKLVVWLEKKYKDWKKRRNGDEDEKFGNDDTNYLTPVE